MANRRILPLPNPATPDPCPCGGQAWLRSAEKISGDWFAVRCEACGREGPARSEGVEAVTAWNNGERPLR